MKKLTLLFGLFFVCFGLGCTSEKNSNVIVVDEAEQTTDVETEVVFEPELYYNIMFNELDTMLELADDGGLYNYKCFKSIYFGYNGHERVVQIEFHFLNADLPRKQMEKLGYGDVSWNRFEGNSKVVRRWTNVNSKVKTITVNMESNGHQTTCICITFWNIVNGWE